MWAYFKFELTQFIRNKKNIAVYVILLFLACFYAFEMAPSYKPIERVDAREIESRYLVREAFLSEFRDNPDRFSGMAGFGLAIYPEWNRLEKDRLDALNTGDYIKYSEATSGWYVYSNNFTYNSDFFSYSPGYYSHGNLYAEDDGYYGYLYSASRYKGYAEGKSELSLNVFEERTALQTVQRLLESYLPLILMIGCIFLTVDIVLKDRLNPTILKGFPISDWKKVVVKGFVALIGSIGMVLPLSIGLIFIGINYGFGDFNLPVPIYTLGEDVAIFLKGDFVNIPMGHYLLENFMLIALIFIFLISLILLSSMVIKNEFANLVVGAVFITNEVFYFKRGIGYWHEVELYPTNYVQVGQILSGYRNYIYGSSQLILNNGLIVMGISSLVLVVFIFIISKIKRYKLI
ncbi:hypothetical protein [Ureibacillus manganicus]|uniref:Uncharacterized protein n=1 Tax=Ureibacillus manganicus DSM 26584 TaxID=1384049 RepID=A0A0A3I5T5_9BACL|nr:hypothetical protein [Ureibacillus manganicus]KGR78855.1 hypothetical protein CD29_09260 [Ureibacillus manganicus DSM 26584]